MAVRKLAAAAAVALALLPGCGSREAVIATPKHRIAVVPKGTTHVFWKSIHAGARKAAQERGNAVILWDGPAKEDERHRQQQIVETLVSERVSALVLAPCDRRTLVAPVERALQQNVPIVIIDSGLELSKEAVSHPSYLGYVATDNHAGGVAAAKRLLELLRDQPRPRVLMLRYQAGSESTERREAGFRETIQQAGNVELLDPPDEAGATVDSAQKASERLLADLPRLDGVFTPNESSTTGMLRALQVMQRTGKVRFVGFDSSDVLLKALENDELQGLVLQDPFDMGYQAVIRALDHLEGQPPPSPRDKSTNLHVLTKDNMKQAALRAAYAPDLKRYLGE